MFEGTVCLVIAAPTQECHVNGLGKQWGSVWIARPTFLRGRVVIALSESTSLTLDRHILFAKICMYEFVRRPGGET